MKNEKQDVVIIGGGCAGIWLAYALAQRRISCAVIDTKPFAAYASTRNQGWLQSGAFYASLKDIDESAAKACKQGYEFITFFNKRLGLHAMHEQIPCYYLFADDKERQEAIMGCRNLHIPALEVDIDDIKSREPILRGAEELHFALQVLDCPIDSSKLLQKVAELASGMGMLSRTVSSLDAVNPSWKGNNWRIALDHDPEIECEAIVLACGACIPKMFERLLPGELSSFNLKKIPVLVMHGDVANSMLITPRAKAGPNLVPFSVPAGKGATVCLLRTDAPIGDCRDDQLPSGYLRKHAISLSRWYRGINTMVSQGANITAHFYVCQKLDQSVESNSGKLSRGHINLSHPPQPGAPKNIFTFYPGKFTAAPIVARECADELEKLLGNPGSKIALQPPAAPLIAKQRYYDPSEYRLELKKGKLDFKSLKS